jgi:hypothetical protein
MTASATPRGPSSPARVLLALVALCALPPLLATALYVSGWRPAHAVNHGALIQPPRALPGVSFHTLDNVAVSFRYWRERWLLIYLAPPGCQAACLDVTHDMQRLRLALGAEARRLQGVIIQTDANMAPTPARGDGSVVIVRATAAEQAQLAATLADDPRPAPGGDYLYLADPLGNLIMRYRRDAAPNGIIQDLKRLMTYSWVG